MLTRRHVLGAAAAGVVSPVLGAVPRALAQAQKRPVRIIIGFPAGGGTDVTGRILAERLRLPYASTVLVENKPGAAARLAGEYVKNAEPDGSVLLYTPDFPITVYPHSFRSLNYDPVRDFTPVSPITKSMLTFNIGPAVPASVKTLSEFVRWAKANPDKAIFATTAAGGTPHFVGVMLANESGVVMTPVHYRGGAPALQDLLGGHVPASVNPVSEVISVAQQGSVRILAVTGSQRSKFLPDVPTMRELGYNVVIDSWIGAPGTRTDASGDSGHPERGDRRSGQIARADREPREIRQRADIPNAAGICRARARRYRALGTCGEGVGIRG